MARRGRGRDRISVRTMPLFRDDLVAHHTRLQTGELDDTQLAYAQAHPDWKPESLDYSDAALWWVARDMVPVVEAAYPTFPLEATGLVYAPSISGILFWEGGLNITAMVMDSLRPDGSVEVSQARVTGAEWTMSRTHGFTIGIIVEAPEMPLGVFHSSPPPGVDAREETDRVMQALASTWLLASQPTVATPKRETSKLRRAWVPKNDQETPSEITVATLRRIEHLNEDPRIKTGEPANYTHRFLVRGHWRNQPCGPKRSQRKPTWVVPYVKGPDDKPFISKDQISVWRR